MYRILAAFLLCVAANAQTTSVGVSVPQNPLQLGQLTTITASVTGPNLSGTIEFLDGFEVIGTAVLSPQSSTAAVAILNYRFTTPKTYQLRAIYRGPAGGAATTSSRLAVPAQALSTRSFAQTPTVLSGKLVDVNGDGNPDLVTKSIRLGDGAGNFGSPVFDLVQSFGPLATYALPDPIADYDLDGKPDLISDKYLFRGNGDGTFNAPSGILGNFGYNTSHAVDLNRDGYPDLVLTQILSGRVNHIYYLGPNFSGVLSSGTLDLSQISGFADIDGDNIADPFGRIFPPPPLPSYYGAPGTTIRAAAGILSGDLNGDGLDDFVWTNGPSVDLFEQISLPGGTPSAIAIASPAPFQPFQLADWNGDGKLDILLYFFPVTGRIRLAYLPGDGTGNFGARVDLDSITTLSTVQPRAFDLNGDGRIDVAIGDSIFLGSDAAPSPQAYTQPVSVTSATSAGSGAFFLANFESTVLNGVVNPGVDAAYLVITDQADFLTSPTTANTCFIKIRPDTSTFEITNDAGTGATQIVHPSNPEFGFNSSCIVWGTSAFIFGGTGILGPVSGPSASYSALLNISFIRSFNGPKSVYLQTIGKDGSSSAWKLTGTFNVQSDIAAPIVQSPTGVPSVVPLPPVNILSSRIQASATFGHNTGAGGHYLGYILFLPVPNTVNFNAAGTCLIEYNRISNGMRLINDDGNGWLGGISGIPAGVPGNSLSNNACTVNVAAATIQMRNDQMTVNVPVELNNTLARRLGVFAQALDVNGRWSDMQQIGSVDKSTSGAVAIGPSIHSYNLHNPGTPDEYGVTVTQGASPLTNVHTRITDRIVGYPACHLIWSVPAATLALVNDAGTGFVGAGFISIGTQVTLANQRCSVNVADVSVTHSGQEHTIVLKVNNLNANGSFIQYYTNAFDAGGLLTHWRVGSGS